MESELELRIGTRVDEALGRIRSKVCRLGMAGKWHLATALDVVRSPELLRQIVEPLNVEECAAYVDRLPNLVAATRGQDRRCATCWDIAATSGRNSDYLANRETLMRLFQQFRFHPKRYERLVRQPEKPVLQNARRILAAGEEGSTEAKELERILRMRVRDCVALEGDIAQDLAALDGARDELFHAHEQLAFEIAHEQSDCDDQKIASALIGLRRAVGWYDHKRGFDFPEYARHWIQEAIDTRR